MLTPARPPSSATAAAASTMRSRVSGVRSAIVSPPDCNSYACKGTVAPQAYRGKETRMRAVVVDRYGPPEVAVVREVPTPAPRAGEVLVRVASAAVTSGDARMRAGGFPPGFAR